MENILENKRNRQVATNKPPLPQNMEIIQEGKRKRKNRQVATNKPPLPQNMEIIQEGKRKRKRTDLLIQEVIGHGQHELIDSLPQLEDDDDGEEAAPSEVLESLSAVEDPTNAELINRDEVFRQLDKIQLPRRVREIRESKAAPLVVPKIPAAALTKKELTSLQSLPRGMEWIDPLGFGIIDHKTFPLMNETGPVPSMIEKEPLDTGSRDAEPSNPSCDVNLASKAAPLVVPKIPAAALAKKDLTSLQSLPRGMEWIDPLGFGIIDHKTFPLMNETGPVPSMIEKEPLDAGSRDAEPSNPSCDVNLASAASDGFPFEAKKKAASDGFPFEAEAANFYGWDAYKDSSNSQSVILLLGECGSGKTTLLKKLLGQNYPGADMATHKFVEVLSGNGPENVPGATLKSYSDLTCMEHFGGPHLCVIDYEKIAHPLLYRRTFIDTPGIPPGDIETLGYDYSGIVACYAERSSRILLIIDPQKRISEELDKLILFLDKHKKKMRIVLSNVGKEPDIEKLLTLQAWIAMKLSIPLHSD